jgi:hypothetical protein
VSGAALLEARLGRATSYRPSACFLSSFLEAYCESPNLTSFWLSRRRQSNRARLECEEQ